MKVISTFSFFFLLVNVRYSEECGNLQNENNPPWNVGIYIENDKNRLELICLGTVFASSYVITAAHCLCENFSENVKNNTFYISSGKLEKTLDSSEDPHLQKIEKKNIFINRAYKGIGKPSGDIAAIKLEDKLKTKALESICVDWDNSKPHFRDGDLLRHSTWRNGNIEMRDVSYVDPDLCQYMASTSFVDLITNDKICAKSKNDISTKDIDDGAGLIFLNFVDNSWYIHGVVSFCDVEKNLATYTNMNIFLNWLSGVSTKP